ncbi:MAG: hypothetical protein U1E17_11625 [Geminicoccaceae bacterium]
MSRPAILLATLAFLAATAASAQESGGVQPGGRFFNPATGSVAQPGPGCRLSQTNVVVGVNRALATGARAGQRVTSAAPSDGCRPLVSTGIVAGVNLGLGFGSTAEQTVQGVTPSGSLSTNSFSRGVNIAGPAAAARQRVLNLMQP